MATTTELLDRGGKALIGNYGRLPVVMVRGAGTLVWDADGRKYLDLFAGFGGVILGHAHPALVEAANKQANTLWHVGNLYYNEPQIEYAERLKEIGFGGKSFFCHSGAEANEAACKLARLRGHKIFPRRWKIISLNNSFHGRTLAMLAATGNPKYRAGFEPDVSGFVQVEAGNFEALASAIDDETAGVLMEPIQGEGGMNVYPADYPGKVRALCDQRELTLIFDEVWTGCGRTGRWFAHQHFTDAKGNKVEPDIMTLGKAAGGGLPVGVMCAKPAIADLLVPGTHGSTLGGNAICMTVAKTILDVVEREKLLEHALALGEHAIARLHSDPRVAGKIAGVRGSGLFLGIELKAPPEKLVEKGMERGIIVNLTAGKVIRLAPPINISREQWDQGLEAVLALIAAL